MSQQHALHMRERQGLLQQRIVEKINLPDRQVVGGAPIGVHLVKQFRRERVCFHDSTFIGCVASEKAGDRLCDHEFFIGANDAYGDGTGVC